jgi:hypothetical protein
VSNIDQLWIFLAYSLIALLADHHGYQVIRVLRHPAQYWDWLLLSAAIIAGVVAIGPVANTRLEIIHYPHPAPPLCGSKRKPLIVFQRNCGEAGG